MRLREYSYVLAIAEQKSITRAAEYLHISQPALSRFLFSLEEEIGTPLFVRIDKQLVPSLAGEKFIEAANEMINLQNKMFNSINRIVHQQTGRINLSITSNRALYLLPAIYARFHEMYPDFYLNVKERGILEIENSLLSGASDIGLFMVQTRNQELNYIPLSREEVVLCISAHSPLLKYAVKRENKRPWIDINYLKDETFFILDPQVFAAGRIAQNIFSENKMFPRYTELRNLDTCLALAARGNGMALCFDISEKYFVNYIDKPVYLSVGKHPYTLECCIVYRKGFQLSPVEKDFIQLFIDELESYRDTYTS